MQVIRKETGVIREVEIENLSLEKPSVVRLKLAPEKVQHFGRRGNDLVLLLKDGSETVIKDFFVVYDGEGRNDLLLEDNEGVLWWGQYTSPWKNFHFTEIEWDEAALIPPWHHGGWLAAALGILGVGAAAGGGGGNSGSTPGDSGGGTEEGIKPPLTSPAIETPENQSIGGKFENKNPSAGIPTYRASTDPEFGKVTLNPDGSYLYTPNPGYHGPDTFTVEVKNPDGTTSTITVIVTVTPVNDAPQAPDDSHITPEDTPVKGKVEGFDPDGDPLTYTEGKPPAHGTVTVDPITGEYVYTPNKDWHGTDTFEV
ncbi:Ig-like domain-containing protein, partial [Comamonas sp.]